MQILIPLIAILLLVPLAVVFVMYILIPLFKGIGWFIRQIFGFVGGEVTDALRVVGSTVTSIVFIPLVIGNIIIGRWSATAHFGRAIQGELATVGVALYRMAVGHPARLLCLTALTDGIEQRLPKVVAAAPGSDKPGKHRAGQFDGYTIVGSLTGGGSGGKLYVAEPDEVRRAAFVRAGQDDVDQVVIKSFSLHDGSSLPQIIRESRALDAAKKLGLVLDHEMGEERFYYTMRYVPGESLGLVTQRLHAMSGAAGLNDEGLRRVMSFVGDLLSTLDTYHRGGLWHKDVKPDNIIVEQDRAHLVDLGLITPLRSAMTLTTHGTEYFRDPEMVRMALRGAKVHQVDGAKFDIYAVGAVLYSVIENSFPAHGGLSQITKRCPETMRWVIRRAMTDYDKRYASTAEVMADLRVIAEASDPFALKPVDLPSMKNGGAPMPAQPPIEDFGPVAAAMPRAEAFAAQGAAAAVGAASVPPVAEAVGASRAKPKIRLASWWTGKYTVEDDGISSLGAQGPTAANPVQAVEARFTPRPAPVHRGHPAGLSAREQVESARNRAKEARGRAKDRIHQRCAGRGGRKAGKFNSNVNMGAATAVATFFGLAFLAITALLFFEAAGPSRHTIISNADVTGVGPIIVPDLPENLRSEIQAVIDKSLEEVARIDEQLAAVGTAAPVASVAPVQIDGTVLLIQDLNPPITDSARAQIRSAVEKLNAAGLNVVGSVRTVDLAEGDQDHHRDLVAQARLLKGLTPLGTTGLAADLGEWLDAENEADAVVWVSTFKNDNPERPDFWVVPRTVDQDDTGDSEYIATLLGVVTGSIGN